MCLFFFQKFNWNNQTRQINDQNGADKEDQNLPNEDKELNDSLNRCPSVKRKSSYKNSIDPESNETIEFINIIDVEDQLSVKDSVAQTEIPTDNQTQSRDGDQQTEEKPLCAVTNPVPAPRGSRKPSSMPTPKPRTIQNVVSLSPETEIIHEPTHIATEKSTLGDADEDETLNPPPASTESGPKTDRESRAKQSLKKLQLSTEEKSQLMNFSFSQDSDSETPASSSSTSSSSRPQDGAGGEEDEYWNGASWDSHKLKKNRRGLRRKEETQKEIGKVRSKFSPWNLSSPRLQHRFSVLHIHPPGTQLLHHFNI